MSKFIAVAVFSCLFFQSAYAQKGNNHLRFIAEPGFPERSGNPGYGFFLKADWGAGLYGQFSFQSGFSSFREKNNGIKTITRVIPFLVGYRQYARGFYMEPQIGYGLLGGKIDIGGDAAKPSVGAWIWAVGTGYAFKRLDFGLRYQSAHGAEKESAGTWHDRNFHFVGVHVGYSIVFSNKKKHHNQ